MTKAKKEKRFATSGNGNFYINDQNVTQEAYYKELGLSEVLAQARLEGQKEAVNMIADGEGWEESRDHYLKGLSKLKGGRINESTKS